jgi:hypothetical protein
VIPEHLQACAGTALMALLARHGEQGPVRQLGAAAAAQGAASAEDDTLSLFGQEGAG